MEDCMKLTDLISKQIINIYDGKICGTIYDILYKDNKLVFLKAFDKNDDEYIVDCSKIYSVGKDAVTVKNGAAMYFGEMIDKTLLESPIGKNVYSLQGEKIGTIEDLEVSKYRIDKYVVGKDLIKCSNIYVGKEIALYDPSTNKLKRRNFAVKMPTHVAGENRQVVAFDNENTKVNTRENDEDDLQNHSISPSIEGKLEMQANKSPSPKKIIGIGSGKFLIKRKVDKTIFGINNEILVKKGATINQNVLDNCTKHGKLFELALHSIDNIATKNTPK